MSCRFDCVVVFFDVVFRDLFGNIVNRLHCDALKHGSGVMLDGGADFVSYERDDKRPCCLLDDLE